MNQIRQASANLLRLIQFRQFLVNLDKLDLIWISKFFKVNIFLIAMCICWGMRLINSLPSFTALSNNNQEANAPCRRSGDENRRPVLHCLVSISYTFRKRLFCFLILWYLNGFNPALNRLCRLTTLDYGINIPAGLLIFGYFSSRHGPYFIK